MKIDWKEIKQKYNGTQKINELTMKFSFNESASQAEITKCEESDQRPITLFFKHLNYHKKLIDFL